MKEFIGSAAVDKRDRLIDELILAPEFNDKWSVWFEDLVGMTETLSTSARRPRIEGRISFDRWIREQMQNNRPMSEIATSTITATGNNYYTENGPASFIVLGSAAMGPVQDTYDLQLVKTVRSYLGLGHYDCLLCHSGRNHLEQLTLWGARGTRSDAERMAAHFSQNSSERRTRTQRRMSRPCIRARRLQMSTRAPTTSIRHPATGRIGQRSERSGI